MGEYVQNHIAIFVQSSRKGIAEKIIKALEGNYVRDDGSTEFLPLDFEKIMPGMCGSLFDVTTKNDKVSIDIKQPKSVWGVNGPAIFDELEGEAGKITKAGDYEWNTDYCDCDLIEYQFSTRNYAPEGVISILAERLEEYGVGMVWSVAYANDSYWNPVEKFYENKWEETITTYGHDLTETQLAMDEAINIDLSKPRP